MKGNNQFELDGLFRQENRLDEYISTTKQIYSSLLFVHGRLDMYLSNNDADYRHRNLARRDNSIMIAMDILKKSALMLVKETYYSDEKRGMYEELINRKMKDPAEVQIFAYVPLSYSGLVIMYENTRSFVTARLNALKKQNPSVDRYIKMIIELLNEHKQYIDG